MKKIKIGVCGLGAFADSFVPLFVAHPLVESVAIADILPERCNDYATRYGLTEQYDSLEALCRSDVDAIALYTQRHLHGQQTLDVLKAGKHCYCSVPMASSLEDIAAILEQVKRTGLIYMSGETSYYYPSTLYCRKRFEAGDFGDFVYGEAQYLHDMSHGFYKAFAHSGGEAWKQVAGFPPMYYPTHSVSMILSVTGAYATDVSCLGYRDHHEDGIFRKNGNLWNNEFSNETALVRTSDGGMMRLNEFRRVGWGGKTGVYMSMFGTQGCYEEHAGGMVWSRLEHDGVVDLQDQLECRAQHTQIDLKEGEQADFFSGSAPIHPVERLPECFRTMKNGHRGSHQFLVDDFVRSVIQEALPPIHAWLAARYCVPGLIAHESALREGEMRSIPDFGMPLADARYVDLT